MLYMAPPPYPPRGSPAIIAIPWQTLRSKRQLINVGEDPALYIPPASRRETLLMNVQLVKVGEDRTLFIPAPTPTLSRKMQFLTVGLHELLYIAVDAAPVTVNPSRIAVASVP